LETLFENLISMIHI